MKRLAGLVLFLLLEAAAVFYILTATESAKPVPSDEAPVLRPNLIAYIPLDDRTDNIDNVIYMAEASGYKIVLPPRDTYSTRLSGQAPNANGTPYGDRAALFSWVHEMDENGCDLFILSLDQLFSGGLVNSRAMREGLPIIFADGTKMTEEEAFDSFILALENDPKNRVYLIDSVVRLASTVGYGGFDMAEYDALRAYGIVARPELSGDVLTLDGVFKTYPFASDGKNAAEAVSSGYDREVLKKPGIIDDYLSVRVRKLTLTDHVISALNALGDSRFTLLVGIDDSSNAPNIQYNELSFIQKSMGEKTHLLGGLDSLARLSVSLIAHDEYGRAIRASVSYIGGSEDVPSSEYDRYTLRETVGLHLKLYGIELVNDEDAELHFLIMTAPKSEKDGSRYCDELISALKRNEDANLPTVLIEASGTFYGSVLESRLLHEIQLPRLIGFSGRYDHANISGAGFAMGVSRYLYLKCCPEQSEMCDSAHARQLANSLALTLYITHTRYDLNLYIQALGYNFNNILADKKDADAIYKKLDELCAPVFRLTEESFKNAVMIKSLQSFAEGPAPSVSIRNAYLPWNRTFEAAFSISAAAPQAS